MSLLEFAFRCRACGLRWVVYGEKPGKRCPFCASEMIRQKRA